MFLQTEYGLLIILDKNDINFNKFINIFKKLQHRGRETYGIGYLKDKLIINKYLGLVNINDISNTIINENSKLWIGHVRYSTSGKKKDKTGVTFNGLTTYICLEQDAEFFLGLYLFCAIFFFPKPQYNISDITFKSNSWNKLCLASRVKPPC